MLGIGDKVIIERVSNASLNLYMKCKRMGLSYIKCPCNSKKGMLFEITNLVSRNGFLLKEIHTNLKTVAYIKDIREVQ